MCKREEQACQEGQGWKNKSVSDKAHIILQPLQDTTSCPRYLQWDLLLSQEHKVNKDLPEDKSAHLKVALDKIKFQPEPLTVNFGRQ